MKILLTGGTGYIGSHAAVVLAEAGHEAILYDNFSNSQPVVVERLRSLVGQHLVFVKGDVRDTDLLANTLTQNGIDAVMHFAGLKAVAESESRPIDYFDNNIAGSISLLRAMDRTDTRRLVFSSSATVYGDPQYCPLDEAHPTAPANAYGRTKLHTEEILADVARSDPRWRIICLRYFNPVGAHASGLIGEDPVGIPNNLLPYIARVADGTLDRLRIFGADYPTPDGTGVRDYIHVMDLVEGHLAALDYLVGARHGIETVNLGTGCGTSVLDMIRAFEACSGQAVPYEVVARRAGDVATLYASPAKALNILGWAANRSLEAMCADTWSFQRRHYPPAATPHGITALTEVIE